MKKWGLPIPVSYTHLDVYKRQEYDRVGDTSAFAEYLGIKIPKLTIPVSPGRNLAIIIEVAARNFRLKSMGYDASQELITRSIGR